MEYIFSLLSSKVNLHICALSLIVTKKEGIMIDDVIIILKRFKLEKQQLLTLLWYCGNMIKYVETQKKCPCLKYLLSFVSTRWASFVDLSNTLTIKS